MLPILVLIVSLFLLSTSSAKSVAGLTNEDESRNAIANSLFKAILKSYRAQVGQVRRIKFLREGFNTILTY